MQMISSTLASMASRIESAANGGRDVDGAGGGASLGHRFMHAVKHRQADMGLAAFAGGDAADHLGAVSDGLLGVEGALRAGDALTNDLGVLVDQDGHAALRFRLRFRRRDRPPCALWEPVKDADPVANALNGSSSLERRHGAAATQGAAFRSAPVRRRICAGSGRSPTRRAPPRSTAADTSTLGGAVIWPVFSSTRAVESPARPRSDTGLKRARASTFRA